MWRKIQKFLAVSLPPLLLLVYGLVAICLLNRWDAMVPITLVPLWAWAAAGALLSFLCWITCRSTAAGFLFWLYFLSGVAFSEETHGILREALAAARSRSEAPQEEAPSLLRIVTVHCAGNEAALRRAAESQPHLLVVREAPDKAVLDAVADQLFGADRSVTTQGGLAILGSGSTLATLTEPSGQALHVRLKRPGGLVLDITAIDLEGCAPRLDMWRPEVWKSLIAARTENRRLVRTYLGEHPMRRNNVARIMAGNFGTPPSDDVFRPLQTSGMVDTFAVAGQGWGNTYPSDYPIFRYDQVWVSPNLEPYRTVTKINPDAPHRIVLSEVHLPPPSK